MRAGITTTMATMTITTTTEALRLLAWLSPAFPTGGFAWSHGVEWAVEVGDVTGRASLTRWLADVLVHGAGRSDAILLRHAHRAADDPAAIRALADLALAMAPAMERRAETAGQGNAFVRAAAAWGNGVLGAIEGDVPYPVAVGALAGAHGISEELAAAGYLQTVAANLVSAAVRLVPLGQSDGLAALAALEGTIAAVAAGTRDARLDDIGGAAFRSDIAAMRHETQYTRLFRS